MSIVIAVANPKGGTGKTSSTLNLAHHLKPTLIIDADDHKGISKLLAMSKTNTAEVRCICKEKEMRQTLQSLSDDAICIVDCGGYDANHTRIALALSDFILTPTCDDPTEQNGIKDFSEILSSISAMIGRDLIANVLPNRIHHARSKLYLPERDNLKVLPMIIPNSAEIPKAAFAGTGVLNGNVAYRYQQLSEYIKNELGMN